MANRIPAELLPIIQRMTNWQRNQWARAGYPIDEKKVELFSQLHRGAEVFEAAAE